MCTRPERTPRPRPRVALIVALGVLAALVLAGGLVGALLLLALGEHDGPPTPETAIAAAGLFIAGAALACVFWMLAQWVKHCDRLALAAGPPAEDSTAGQDLAILSSPASAAASPTSVAGSLSEMASGEPDPPAATDVAAGRTEALLEEILAELRRLNESILLTPEQRRLRRQQQQEKLAASLRERFEKALAAGRFDQAGQVLAELAERLPEQPGRDELADRLREARAAAVREDIENAERKVTDLMAVGSFVEAEQVAAALHERHGEEPDAAELLRRVRREAKAFEEERRQRLYRQVEKEAEARRWRAARKAAGQFLDAFPEGPSADAVRAMLPTIEDNARIEEVRELRDRIRDLIERRRYAEAVEVAGDVIRRFPDTRAAAELGRQLDRLRRLAGDANPDRRRR